MNGKKLPLLMITAALSLAGPACVPSGNNSGGGGGQIPLQGPALEEFSSEEEFQEYMEALIREEEERRSAYEDYENSDDYFDAAPEAEADAGSEMENEEITNNQEEGVDEGGIVKNIGDYLIVLRRGALYSVKVAESGETQQVDSIRVAPAEDLNQGVWYDEMLVRGNRIYVIGYRYVADVLGENDESFNWIFGATEVTSFALNEEGEFSRGESTFLESNDYYSGTNYASRMVDGKIIFYMPYYAFIRSNNETLPRIPRVLEHHQGSTFRSNRPLFSPTDILRPLETPRSPTFHTVIQCELPDDLSIDCQAKSLLGESSRDFYVSRERIYLWSSGHVFAISQLDGSARAHSAQGQPVDQFSFREVDEALYVGTRRYVTVDGSGEEVADPDWSEAENLGLDRFERLEMVRLPLQDFDNQGAQDLGSKVRVVSDLERYSWWSKNRHVGEWYLFGDGEELIAHRRDGTRTERIAVGGRISRIESMTGIGALVVSSHGEDMQLESLLLGDEAALVAGATMAQMNEGESRSHGFFFRPDQNGGVFGLPVVNVGSSYGWWGTSISNIAFFRAEASGDVALRGVVSSSDESGVCETSCVDWYGNTRPIFLRDRVYALMGSEVVEAQIGEEGVNVVGAPVVLTRD